MKWLGLAMMAIPIALAWAPMVYDKGIIYTAVTFGVTVGFVALIVGGAWLFAGGNR